MKVICDGLRQKERELVEELARVRAGITEAERVCSHTWSEVEYVPEHRKGYHVPADGAGSDFRPAVDGPPETIPKWRRTCQRCGKIEETRQTVEVATQVPKFPGDVVF